MVPRRRDRRRADAARVPQSRHLPARVPPRGADPERGRFRDYVKRALINLVIDYHKRKQARPQALPEQGVEEPAADSLTPEADQEFLDRWREELLARTWETLAEFERREGKPYHTVLHFRAANPHVTSGDMATELAARSGGRFTAISVRLILHRAREQFARLLIAEVSRSLQTSEPDRLEQELMDLGLYAYCRPIFVRDADVAERGKE